MAATIAEPQDLPSGSITPENENNFSILTYQKSQEDAGIKQLALGDWKSYLGFNSHKVNNVATYVGIDTSEYDWEQNSDVPYSGTPLTNRIEAVAAKVGVNTEPGTVTETLSHKIDTLEDYVKDGWEDQGTPVLGLLDRVSTNEQSISDINTIIGDTSGLTPGDTLVSLIDSNTTSIGNNAQDITDINTEIGSDSTSGTIKGRIKANEDAISDINTAIGDDLTPSTIKGRISKNETDIASLRESVASAYGYCGDIYSADANGITTTIGTLEWSDLHTGNVFNIRSSDTTADGVYVKGKFYSNGTNIAWVSDISDFDELGSAIDVTQLQQLETEVENMSTDVDALKERFETSTDTSWDSSSLNGFYIICVSDYSPIDGTKTCTQMIYFINGRWITKIDLSNNFTDFFDETPQNTAISLSGTLNNPTVYAIKLS